jgi:hypothetical protein
MRRRNYLSSVGTGLFLAGVGIGTAAGQPEPPLTTAWRTDTGLDTLDDVVHVGQDDVAVAGATGDGTTELFRKSPGGATDRYALGDGTPQAVTETADGVAVVLDGPDGVRLREAVDRTDTMTVSTVATDLPSNVVGLARTPGGRYGVVEDLTGNNVTLWGYRADGQVVFERDLEAPSAAVTATSDGGFVLAGTEVVDDQTAQGFAMEKHDSEGEFVWEETYKPDARLEEQLGQAVAETADGGLVIVGFWDAGGGWVVNTDSQGDREWDVGFDDTEAWGCSDVAVTADGRIVCFEAFGGMSPGDDAAYLHAVDADGAVQWSAELPELASWFGGGLAATPDGYGLVHDGTVVYLTADGGTGPGGSGGDGNADGGGQPTATGPGVVDDFADGDLEEYVALAGSVDDWTIQGEYATAGDSALQFAGGDASEIASFDGLPRYPAEGDRFTFDFGTFGEWDFRTSFQFAQQRNAGFHHRYEIELDPPESAVRLQYDPPDDSDRTLGTTTVDWDFETFYTVAVDWGSDEIAVSVNLAGDTIGSLTGTTPDDAPATGGIGFFANGDTDAWVYDDVEIG